MLSRFRLSSVVSSTVRRFSSVAQSETPFIVDRYDDQGKIVLFRINRPETKNAINRKMAIGFQNALDEMKYDKQTRVIIIKSDVPGAFCAGADLKERRVMPAEDIPKFVNFFRNLLLDMSRLPVPIIAAIDGFALGGGLEMALACDLRVAATTARVGLTETRLAIIPGAGGTQRLTRAVGVAQAKELIFTGRMINGAEAAQIGLVNHVVESNGADEAAFNRALKLAQEIAPQGPIALKMAKISIDRGSEVDLETGLTIEQQCYAQVIPTKDRMEGLNAFREKRPPVYTGE